MKTRFIVAAVIVLTGIAVVRLVWSGITAGASETTPLVFASPVNGGCYVAAPGQCRLHIEPYTVNVGAGQRLLTVKLQANGITIYDYRTDVSNPPLMILR